MNLGYACINLTLDDNKPNRRTTAKYLKKLTPQEQLDKLNGLLKENLTNTLKILKFNVEHNIKLYRISSDIVPLSTHPITSDWDYIEQERELLEEIGDFVKDNNLLVSMHPGQYTVLNSNSEDVVERAIEDLEYHSKILEAMGLSTKHRIVLHIGGVYGDKESAIKRFKENFKKLSKDIQERLIIENDDKSYTSSEVLAIAQDLDIPMVFDVHHFNCNHQEDEVMAELFPQILETWPQEETPKIHFSSPRNEEKFLSHADYIDSADFNQFMSQAKEWTDRDFNVMLECKKKDKALRKLRYELDY
ncbi:UV DNA damage repair endonuclease UvsE [Halanaerobacter jeridensis]|uniref:UV DNA damage endonuclease n=1 Tax=Halanaerobacter jeridensis TaxID=706427 RepID=A0A939BPT5_9FIRM|nr:UV DNA damage repair endonuclease UvsE [Halanaerobacter jeridensis]MBM7555564.1 UV DNA damage endonuclease [Halanaerobacter jeridensis]